MSLADKLNALRDKHGLTYQQLSDASGVPVGTLKSILTGTTANPGFDTVCTILAAMGESVDAFCGDPPTAAPSTASGHHCSVSIADISEETKKIARAAIRETYESAAYKSALENLRVWRAVALLEMALIVCVLLWDITHPTMGYIQYTVSAMPEIHDAACRFFGIRL